MGFHIAAPFYTKELRQLIKQLKAEGRLNERPLWELDKTFIRVFLILSFLPSIVLIFTTQNYITAIIFLGLVLLASIIVLISLIKYYILPSSSIKIVRVVILSEPRVYYQGLDLVTKLLTFEYKFLEDENLQPNKSYKLTRFPEKFCGDMKFKYGQTVDFIVNQKSPSKSIPLTPKIMELWSLDLSYFK